jgi:peptidoglycan hydrolase-like protein with peptidoglycan-binding domain
MTDVGLFHGAIDGRYGGDLLAAVDTLQRQAGLPVDGEYGPRTAAALDGLYARTVPGTPTSPTTTIEQTTSTTDPDNAMQLGRQSAKVLALQQRLAALGYRPGTADGYFSADTQSAVLAFEKREGLARDGIAGPEVQAALLAPKGSGPRAGLPVPRIEVDIARQMAFVVLADGSVTTLNVSTGSGLTYTDPTTGARDVAYTPVGSFAVQREVDADVKAPLGTLHRPMYFFQGWAVHGAASVPAYPASHGCVRVSDDDADWLFPHIPVGTAVVVYDTTGKSAGPAPAGAAAGY